MIRVDYETLTERQFRRSMANMVHTMDEDEEEIADHTNSENALDEMDVMQEKAANDAVEHFPVLGADAVYSANV